MLFNSLQRSLDWPFMGTTCIVFLPKRCLFLSPLFLPFFFLSFYINFFLRLEFLFMPKGGFKFTWIKIPHCSGVFWYRPCYPTIFDLACPFLAFALFPLGSCVFTWSTSAPASATWRVSSDFHSALRDNFFHV